MDPGLRWLVGIIQVPLSSLVFPRNVDVARQRIYEYSELKTRRAVPSSAVLKSRRAQNINNKVRLFKRGECRPDLPENQLSCMIDYTTYQKILQALRMTADALRNKPFLPEFIPKLRDFQFHCRDGRQRYEAALRVYGPDFLWTVRLYYAPSQDGPALDKFLALKADAFGFQEPYSDGEIFRRYWGFVKNKDYRQGTEWLLRLSTGKEGHLKLLMKCADLVTALGKLVVFPGLLAGLQLGNVHRWRATRCVAQLALNVDHIADTYMKITGNESELVQATDTSSVNALDGLIPGGPDEAHVRRLIKDFKIYSNVTDENARTRLLDNLLSIKWVIPTLRTFDENTRYLAIGSRIIRKYILPPDALDRGTETIYDTLRQYWNSPYAMVEVKPGLRFKIVPNRSGDYDLAYRQLFLAAQRLFPFLTEEQPMQDYRGEKFGAVVDHRYVVAFCWIASRLGFRTQPIAQKIEPLSWNSVPELPGPETSWGPYVRDWRAGRPPLRTFVYLQSQSFLPSLAGPWNAARDGVVSPRRIQKDFMDHFFFKNEEDFSERDLAPCPDSPERVYHNFSETRADREDDEDDYMEEVFGAYDDKDNAGMPEPPARSPIPAVFQQQAVPDSAQQAQTFQAHPELQQQPHQESPAQPEVPAQPEDTDSKYGSGPPRTPLWNPGAYWSEGREKAVLGDSTATEGPSQPSQDGRPPNSQDSFSTPDAGRSVFPFSPQVEALPWLSLNPRKRKRTLSSKPEKTSPSEHNRTSSMKLKATSLSKRNRTSSMRLKTTSSSKRKSPPLINHRFKRARLETIDEGTMPSVNTPSTNTPSTATSIAVESSYPPSDDMGFSPRGSEAGDGSNAYIPAIDMVL